MKLVFVLTISMVLAVTLSAQTTEFTYQGSLKDGANPANGNYDIDFRLFDAASGGSQVGNPIVRAAVPVVNGIFSVDLDFVTGFPGADRYLEIRVRTAGVGSFTLLAPRQKVTSSPYAVKSLAANTADSAVNATRLDGLTADNYVRTTDPRMFDARTPLPGSGNYVQNATSPQPTSNFNISGTGTATIFSATTQYNIGANRVLSVAGTNNVFAGVGAGAANTTGDSNSFFGRNAGLLNTTGGDNAFFGTSAGSSNTTGIDNAFFGRSAGDANTTGFDNAFFGRSAGNANTTGGENSFFGRSAGSSNTTGLRNSFFGTEAGGNNTTGGANSFFGMGAGDSNTTGGGNTIIGSFADVSSGALTFATAIGAQAIVTASNRVQVGRSGSDTVRIGDLAAATATQLCINSNVLAACTSSRRYKENIIPFSGGMNLVSRLQPVAYDWIESKDADLGLIAEDVAEVEPLLVTHNNKGEIQGVKYDQLTVVLINAAKEQQTQIERQQKQIDEQRREIRELKKIVCSLRPEATGCVVDK